MMEGKLPKEYADRWAWDQPRTGESANPTYQIVGDLQDLVAGRLDGSAILPNDLAHR